MVGTAVTIYMDIGQENGTKLALDGQLEKSMIIMNKIDLDLCSPVCVEVSRPIALS